MTSITSKYQCFFTGGYSPVTVDDGAAAGGVVHHEARRLPDGTIRLRRTAANGHARTRSATEDMTEQEFDARFGHLLK